MIKEEDIHSILFCDEITHKDMAEISGAVGKNVGVSIARGDSPSSKVVKEAMKEKVGFHKKGEK